MRVSTSVNGNAEPTVRTRTAELGRVQQRRSTRIQPRGERIASLLLRRIEAARNCRKIARAGVARNVDAA